MENTLVIVREVGVWLSKDHIRNPYGETVLDLGSINVNILVVILYYTLQDVGENWVKGTWVPFVLFLTTASSATITSR